MSATGAGFGHQGAVGEILDALPLDSTFHVTECGYDANERCGCYDLPARLRRIVRNAQAAVLREVALSVPKGPVPDPADYLRECANGLDGQP